MRNRGALIRPGRCKDRDQCRSLHKQSTMRRAKQIGTLALLAALLSGAAGASFAQSSTKPAPGAEFKTLAAKAAAAQDAEHLDEAAALYRKALRINPRWAEGWWSLGAIDYDADRYAEASLEFQKVVALDLRHGTARVLLGLCQFRLGQDGEALKNIEAAKATGIAADEQLRREMFYDEGVLLQRAGRFEAARDALGSLCQRELPTRTQSWRWVWWRCG